jgi:lupus La protein
MRHFQPYSAVVDALCDSDVLEVVDKDKTGEEMVKRKKALVAPKDVRDEKRAPFVWELYNRCSAASWKSKLGRSAYAKGFNGSEEKGNVKDVSQVNLELFFKPFGCVSVRKRRDDEGIYKGSVFVEFESEDSLKQFLELDPKPKYQGNELLTMSKSGYNEMKCKEKGIVPGWQRNRGNDGSHENSRDRGGHGGRSRGRGRGRGRGSGDYNNRSHDDRRRRERSNSRGSNEEGKKNWKERRDNFQKNRGGRSGRDDGESRKSPERDVQGVPVIKDTRTKEEKAAAKNRKAEADGDKADVEGSESKKRKADDDGRTDAPKKKIEIREDA